MEIVNSEAKLSEEQTIIVAGLLKGALLNHNEKIKSGVYVEKGTRELFGTIAEMVRKLEDNDIL